MRTLALTEFFIYPKSNFTISFIFLPKNKREAMNLIYNWCRVSDNIVDAELPLDEKKKFLVSWIKEFEKGLKKESSYQILNNLSTIIEKFNIPTEHFKDLLRGMEFDLIKNSYNNFQELDEYCYCVASTVGLISAKIFGYKNKSMEDYAITLGKALQLTNILRDVKQDAKKGRIYLPIEDLKKFNVDKKQIFENNMNDDLRNLLKYNWERAYNYFIEADKYLSIDDKKGFLAAQIMKEIYFTILLKIRDSNYEVFTKTLKLSASKKISIALNCRWKNR
ncbi:MAG: squalene/phytoene synthase family protein [Bacteroidetes bacterium]|nr:squalene/phytoene synthase family protein [Bacteroidota bacterium]